MKEVFINKHKHPLNGGAEGVSPSKIDFQNKFKHRNQNNISI